MFMKLFTAPNGAVLNVHRVARAEVTSTGIEITVHSWPDEDAFLAGKPPLWQSRFDDPGGQQLLTELESAVLIGAGVFAGATIVELGDVDMEQLRRRHWAAIKQHRQALDEAAITVDGFAIDADFQSRQDLMGAIMSMQITGQASRPWRCADNVMRELTLAQIVDAGTAIAARRQQLIETSDTLYQQIQAATDAAALAAITWPQP